jgi:uncharacterized membrane protein
VSAPVHPAELPDERTIGERAADVAAAVSGSWRFILAYLGTTAAWMAANAAGLIRFDPYPFILYTCGVSVLAILMSSLILLADNRKAAVDRAHAENAYHHVEEVLALVRILVAHIHERNDS